MGYGPVLPSGEEPVHPLLSGERIMLLPLRRRDKSLAGLAIIDAEDFERVGHHRWYLSPRGYVRRNMPHPDGPQKQTLIPLHRAVMGLGYGDPRHVDHRNHILYDCRKANLRICTHAENHQNRRASGNRGTSSRYRGVSYAPGNCKSRPWIAYAYVNGRFNFLGYHAVEDEAAEVAAAFRAEHMPFTLN